MTKMIARWYDCLKGYSDEEVEGAFRTALCRSSMPPTIADIIGTIERQERLKEPSDMALWAELKDAIEKIKKQVWDSRYGFVHLFEMKDTMNEPKDVYDDLREDIRSYIDFDSFCAFGAYTDEQLQFERARFLKAIPEIRQALRDKRTIEDTKSLISAGKGIQQLTGGK